MSETASDCKVELVDAADWLRAALSAATSSESAK